MFNYKTKPACTSIFLNSPHEQFWAVGFPRCGQLGPTVPDSIFLSVRQAGRWVRGITHSGLDELKIVYAYSKYINYTSYHWLSSFALRVNVNGID